jgi:predicted outer membrane repeat protein
LGGGLIAGALSLTGTQFLSNTAGGGGGGAVASGDVSLSGGLFERNASPAGSGGGLYAQGSLILTGTQFLSNTAALYGGGALLSGPATLNGGLFQSNASSWGGGLLAGNTLTLSGTQFLNNAAALYGGGAFANGAATLNGGLFRNNVSAGSGGGLALANALALTGTQFVNNAAGTDGGGLYLLTETTNPKQVVNALFARNRAAGNGAAIYAHAAPFSLIHSTIVSPTAPTGAAQAVYVLTSTVYLTNTLIASHTVGIEQAASTVTEWNTLYSGVATPRVGTVSSSDAITGPAGFVNPAADDYHLMPSSAAIDTGTTPGPDVTSDVDGDARPQQGGYDIGYDESPYPPPSVPISTSVVVVPELGATLTTTSALVEVPAGAITQTITLVYEPSTATGGSPSGTLLFAGLAFSLTAVQDGSPLSGFVFERPVTVTLRYTDADVMGLVEANLQPFYFNATTGLWQADGIVVLARRLPENEIVFTISHLTRFGLFAPTQQRAFLPVMMRGGSAISGVP